MAVCKGDLFLHFWYGNWMVYWRKLDGLLTGRIIDGKWVFCWRKQDGLLKETGLCVDGNWIVNWRKLVGLLMETVQQIFFILGAWKFDFFEFRNSRFRGHLAFFNSFFSIWEARKYDFWWVVKPMVQNNQASCEQILRILASWSKPKRSQSKRSQAKRSKAKPSEEKPSQANPREEIPSQAKRIEGKLSEAKPSQAKPSKAKPCEAKPSQAVPSEAKRS